MSSVFKVTTENKTTSVITHFYKKINDTNNVFIVSLLLSKVTCMLQFLHHMFNLFALLRGDPQAGDATDQWRDR